TYAYNTNLIIQSNEQQLKERSQYFSFVRDTSTVRVALKGVPLSPSSGALVFWNKQSNEVYIDIQSLPDPPAGMQYQLWALDNGVPVDAGVFTANNTLSTFQKMKGIKNAQAFAVTLEKEGGVASPTLSAMYVLGTI
ncbi:MAG: anti-sigma factor, partial [Cytophagales bacterium]|nr:anti-sigma factor [Cytophaga sp.]